MSLSDAIFQEFRDAIDEGRYQPGDQLPSIRELAETRNCNKLTVKKAYDKLKEAGYMENSVGRGSFVSFPRRIGSQEGLFSFQVASIGADLFPLEEVRILTDKLFRDAGTSLFSAAPPGGDPRCLDALAQFYGMPADRTVIISGAQQGLNLAGRLFSGSVSESVLFEDPTYSGAVNLFRPRRFVPLGEDGPDLQLLETHAGEGIDAFYTMPQIHNPTGISYTSAVMEKIAELAGRYNFLIIEDDYLSEFLPYFFEKRPLRFLDLLPERTIHIKSISKVTAPGIRLGLLVAPESLKEELLFSKFTSDIGTSSFMQNLVRVMVETSLLEKSIRNNRLICGQRRVEMEKLLDRFPFLSYRKGLPGYNIWVKSGIDPAVAAMPWAGGENFSFDPLHRFYFRLSFMALSDSGFASGLEYLSGVLAGLQQSGHRGIY
jgi:2-aminoadipate transaminase